MDGVDPAKRSDIMRSVRQRNTKPEMALRSGLHARGLRFRLHAKDLPGRPDVVFRSRKACVFVHGCFWHRHGCSKSTTPKSNVEFWSSKFEANVRRDARAVASLVERGWRVLLVWECGLKDRARIDGCVEFTRFWLDGGDAVAEYPPKAPTGSASSGDSTEADARS